MAEEIAERLGIETQLQLLRGMLYMPRSSCSLRAPPGGPTHGV